MHSEEQLHWIRRFYRAKLARYAAARYLKKAYLVGWYTWVWVRAFLVWYTWVRMRAFLVWHISSALSRLLRFIMHSEEQLHWIRRFYRAKLARYAAARYLKKAYLVGWYTWVWVRAFLVWHISSALSRLLRFIMHSEEQLHWIRRFYRAKLARYATAGYLKKAYLVGWYTWVRVRAFLVWHISSALSRHLSRLDQVAHCHPVALVRFSASVTSDAISGLLILVFRITRQRAVWYRMRTFSSLMVDGDRYHELVPARIFPTPMPDVQPAQYACHFPDSDYPLPVAAIGVLEITDAQVLSKSDLIFTGDVCLHHDLYRFGRDFLFEEMHSVVSMNAKHDRIVRFKGDHVQSIQQGISLAGSTTSNYIHWLTEALPKLALIDRIDAYADIPYIVDSGLHPNILESIRLLNSRQRPLVEVGPSELLEVERLLCVTPTAYVPFDFHPHLAADKLDINPSSAMYSPDALQRLRQLLVSTLIHAPVVPRKKLYLRRSGRSRPMENSDAVESLMLEQGFTIVEPETLSFSDQVRLFSDAGVIVGQGGAALGNIIFAPAGCHLVVLTTWSPYTIHYYFANLAAALGQRCTLIMCEPARSELGEHRAHMGVNVPILTLLKAIQ